MGGTTLRDVAERAGVSIRTVSNVVTGAKTVAEPTRVRVQRAIEELNYRPNMVARSLRSGRSSIIGVAVPELSVPYFAELVGEITDHAREQGYLVMVDQTDGDRDRERQLLAATSQAQIFDGLIVSALSLTSGDLRRRDHRVPLVLLGEHISDGSFDHVGIDNVAAARQATTHLLSLGRNRIAAIGNQPFDHGETAQLRLLGFEQAHRLAGREPDPELIISTRRFHRALGARAMADLLDGPRPPDAVFCFNDLLALGALKELHRRGVAVPEQVAVVGFDDIEDGRYAVPSLTTVAPDKPAIAATAVELLIARITGSGPGARRDVWVGHDLRIRESTVPQPVVRTAAGSPRSGPSVISALGADDQHLAPGTGR